MVLQVLRHGFADCLRQQRIGAQGKNLRRRIGAVRVIEVFKRLEQHMTQHFLLGAAVDPGIGLTDAPAVRCITGNLGIALDPGQERRRPHLAILIQVFHRLLLNRQNVIDVVETLALLLRIETTNQQSFFGESEKCRSCRVVCR